MRARYGRKGRAIATIWEGEVRLAPGARVSDPKTGTAQGANGSSYALDSLSHAFLTRFSVDWKTLELSADQQTLNSLARLTDATLIETRPELRSDVKSYTPHYADLVIRRHSVALTLILTLISHIMRPLVSIRGSIVGLLLLVGSIALSFLAMDPSQLWATWAREPVSTSLVVLVAVSLRTLVHEAGHFSVARNIGCSPRAGFGLYFTGPVLFVDLSSVDTANLSIRIRSDVAGIAVDGYIVAGGFIVFAANMLNSPRLQVALFAIVMTTLASLNPLYKSDVNWALRDLMSARQITASWSRPGELVRGAKAQGPGQRYCRLVLGLYAAYVILLGASFFNIARDVLIDGLLVPSWDQVVPLFAAFLCLGLVVFVVRKKGRTV